MWREGQGYLSHLLMQLTCSFRTAWAGHVSTTSTWFAAVHNQFYCLVGQINTKFMMGHLYGKSAPFDQALGAYELLSQHSGVQSQNCGKGTESLSLLPLVIYWRPFVSCPCCFRLFGLANLIPRGGILPPGNTTVIPLNLRLLSGQFDTSRNGA